MCFVVNVIRMDGEHFPWPTREFKLEQKFFKKNHD